MNIPRDDDIENNVLGSLFQDKEAIHKISLTEKDFFGTVNKTIFKAMCSLRDEKTEIDLVSIGSELGKEKLDYIGGHSYLAHITNLVPTASHIVSKSKKLKELTYRRDLMDKAHKLVEASRKGKDIEKSKRELLDIGMDSSNSETMTELADRYLEEYEKPIEKGLTIGLPKIDEITNGFKGGDLTLIMADTNAGKTMLLLNIAVNSIRHDKKVMIVSLEMKSPEIFQRIMTMYGELDPYKLKYRDKDSKTMEGIANTIGQLAEKNIKIISSGSMTSAEIRQQAFLEQRKNGLDILLVDSLPLINDDRKAKDSLEIASKTLKSTAMDLDIPVITPVQTDKLSRRDKKEPQKEDIKDSTEPANDASVILSVTDEDYGKGVWLLKHRDGEKNVLVKCELNQHLIFKAITDNTIQ